MTGDETPGRGRSTHRVPVLRRGNAEGVGVGDRFAQKVDQRVVDARVLDAPGRKEKLHARLQDVAIMTLSSRVGDSVLERQGRHHSRTPAALRPVKLWRTHLGMTECRWYP